MIKHDDMLREFWDPVQTRKLAHRLADIACDELFNFNACVRSPRSARHASQLLSKRNINIDLVSLVRKIQGGSLHLSNPRFMAQQVAAPIPLSALIESVISAMNQSLAVWEMSPIATAIDRDLMSKFKKLFGYPKGAEGSLVPGGGFANLTALLAARDTIKSTGSRVGSGRLAVIAGEQTHYSIDRATRILGLGSDAIFKVELDTKLCTSPKGVQSAFRIARRAGFRRFILVGSAGSTPTGSFDDLTALHKIAKEESAWFHVDAAHGGGIAFSRRFKKMLKGIGRADSLSFDPHKMMFVPLSAGGVLVRRASNLTTPLSEQAPYLFGPKRTWPDVGQCTIACSQRFEALKVWLIWRIYGEKIWDVAATHVCDVAQAAYQFCVASRVIQPVHEPQSNIFCFELRGRRHDHKADLEHWKLKETLNESGSAYISSTVLEGRRVLRLVIMNPRTTAKDVHDVLGLLEKLAIRRSTTSRRADL